jgi:hypothetical protein
MRKALPNIGKVHKEEDPGNPYTSRDFTKPIGPAKLSPQRSWYSPNPHPCPDSYLYTQALDQSDNQGGSQTTGKERNGQQGRRVTKLANGWHSTNELGEPKIIEDSYYQRGCYLAYG